MRNAETLAAVESILLLNVKSVISSTCNFVNGTILEHRIKAMYFRRT